MKCFVLVLVALLMTVGCSLAENMPLIEWTPQNSELSITGEIRDSWEEIIAHIDDGSAKERYAVGAWKPLDLGQYGVVNMQLAGFDLDERADGQGKVATTWIARELLEETHCMHSDDNSYRGWKTSELRQWLQSEVWNAIHSVVQDRIIAVRKSRNHDRYATTEDKVWIPDREEVFGTEAIYYGLFKNENTKRVKTRNGSANWWWLRSANTNYHANGVNSDGSYTYYYVSHSGGVVLGFCM